ncbi:MAG: sigma-70 family RNA polymerase sigma factor [Candidatus Pacebacteria bacterium]|nr:sigma-70 family RNA polymerase sigma factor [Candidatus Paceibacterota bacterium]
MAQIQTKTPDKLDEKELIEKLKAGNKRALYQWFNHYQPPLLKYALTRAQSEKDAKDLVQETFINSYKQIQLFRGECKLLSWMTSILRHEIADYYRKKYAKRAIRTVPLAEHLLSEPLDDSSQVADKVKQALGKMLERRKKLLLLKYVDGLPVKEIAQHVGRTFKAVEADLYRARESFRKLYGQS